MVIIFESNSKLDFHSIAPDYKLTRAKQSSYSETN